MRVWFIEFPRISCPSETFGRPAQVLCLNEHWFQSLKQARVEIGRWRTNYNEVRAAQQLRANAASQVRCAAPPNYQRLRPGAGANPGVISFKPADSSDRLVRVLGAGRI
jgi:hypothetical protein